MFLTINQLVLSEQVLLKLFSLGQTGLNPMSKQAILDRVSSLHDELFSEVSARAWNSYVAQSIAMEISSQLSPRLSKVREEAAQKLMTAPNPIYIDEWSEEVVIGMVKSATMAFALLIDTVIKKRASQVRANKKLKTSVEDPVGLLYIDGGNAHFQILDLSGVTAIYRIRLGYLACFLEDPEAWEDFFQKGLEALVNYKAQYAGMILVPCNTTAHADGRVFTITLSCRDLDIKYCVQSLYKNLERSILY